MVEQWNKDGRTVEQIWRNRGKVIVEQRWWNSGTDMVKQWNNDGGTEEQL